MFTYTYKIQMKILEILENIHMYILKKQTNAEDQRMSQ